MLKDENIIDKNIHPVPAMGTKHLEFAVKYGYEGAVKLLLGRGVDPNFQSKSDGMPPIHRAVENGHDSILTLLIEYNADVNFCLQTHSPLSYAISLNKTSAAKILLDNGANINFICKFDGMAPIHWAVKNGDGSTLTLLVKYGANINIRLQTHSTPLSYAISIHNMGAAKILLENGANIHEFFEIGDKPFTTVVSQAAYGRNLILLKWLLKYDKLKNAPYLHSVIYNISEYKNDNTAKEIVRLLLRHVYRISFVDKIHLIGLLRATIAPASDLVHRVLD